MPRDYGHNPVAPLRRPADLPPKPCPGCGAPDVPALEPACSTCVWRLPAELRRDLRIARLEGTAGYALLLLEAADVLVASAPVGSIR